MSVEFSAKISMLRKEKNITQKQAAADLEISQALLSHYEKGIRECSLDFVKKAARYYDVSADFLLGLTDLKHGADNLMDPGEIDGDRDLNLRTLLRALLGLYTDAENDRETSKAFLLDYFSLCVRQYAAFLSDAPETDRRRAELCALLLAERRRQEGGKTEPPSLSAAARTVIERGALRMEELTGAPAARQ